MALSNEQKKILMKNLPKFSFNPNKGRTSFEMYSALKGKRGNTTPSSVANYLKKVAHCSKDKRGRLRFCSLPSEDSTVGTHASNSSSKYE